MIRLDDNLWIGDSGTPQMEMWHARIGAVLNVAHDLRSDVGWPDIEYMQVGLIDGPGNPIEAYYSAVFALASLLLRRKTLVCCHTGSRSLVVAMMYLNIAADASWEEMVGRITERVDEELPVLHEAHRAAFDMMDWKVFRNR